MAEKGAVLTENMMFSDNPKLFEMEFAICEFILQNFSFLILIL